MEQIQTIGAVSKILGISSRMLRYYEQVGLIECQRTEDYAYRVYNENTVRRLRQIIILRKLRVPVRQIREIFDNNDAAKVVAVFERNVTELDEQITALSTVRAILSRLAHELKDKANVCLQLDHLSDSSIFAIVDSISFSNNIIQEEEKSVNDLHKADKTLNKFNEVKYVKLAPARAVAFNAVSSEPEDDAFKPIRTWLKENNLEGTARIYLFNIEPYQTEGNPEYGMGCCATIPEGIEIPEHFYEKRLPGGIYVMSEWKDQNSGWETIKALLSDPKWEWEYDGREGCRGLEEHIERADGGFIINILLPIKRKLEEKNA